MIDRGNVLPLTRQASLLQLSRSSVYYLPRPVPPARLAIMHRIDALHLEHPFAGSRMLRDLLRAEGVVIGRLAVATLMRRMGIEALYRRPSTSKPAPGHKIYPYLLRNLVVDRPNQVWAMDITYIPMARGFVYLAAVVDWFSRRVLAWRLSITLETEYRIRNAHVLHRLADMRVGLHLAIRRAQTTALVRRAGPFARDDLVGLPRCAIEVKHEFEGRRQATVPIAG
jgi:transposase InsO family protein